MKKNNLPFEELCTNNCFLLANSTPSKMSVWDMANILENKHYFTKEELSTVTINGTPTAVNARFNGNGKSVLIDDNEPVIQLLFVPPG